MINLLAFYTMKYFEHDRIKNKHDRDFIEEYFEVYKIFSKYLMAVVDFEQEKISYSIPMTNEAIDEIISFCNLIIDSKGSQVKTYFDEEIKVLEWLGTEKKEHLMEMNQIYVEEYMVKAYEYIRNILQQSTYN